LPHAPLEAKDKQKQRKVCPVNLRGEVCMADNCGSKHPQVCLVANHGKGKIPKSTCMLWHMRIPRENPTGNISNNNAQPAKPDDKYLARLEAECRAEELKARIRATKLMSQGITYSQMVEGPPHRVPAQVARRAVRTALTPDAAIAILEDTVKRLRLLRPQKSKNGIRTSLRPPGRPGRQEKGIQPCNKEEMLATRPYKTSNGEDGAKGVVSGVGKVKVKEGYEVCGVKVGEVNDKVDKAKI
jgi:hypothetical protein